MKKSTSRRLFLRNSAFVITGLAVGQSVLANSFSESTSPFLGYNPYAESKNDLRQGIFSLNPLTVKGIIYENDGNTPVKEAQVEVWHLSPNSSKYRHRAKLQTNGQGEYEFITDFPNKEKGKNARIFFKVSSGENTNFTELLINSTGAHITAQHWKEHNKLGDKLFPKKKDFLNQSTINFNISI